MIAPHIDADPGAFAETVLLPGDPLRARYIAGTHLTGARQVCGLRNMLGYTGTHDGRPVSVMGTGMGMPSLAIYVTELVRHFGVRRLIRVGTCGALQPGMALGGLVLALGAGTDSALAAPRHAGAGLPLVCDGRLLQQALVSATRLGLTLTIGGVFSTDAFYPPDAASLPWLSDNGVLAVDMETAALYGLAASFGVQALSLLAVSDRILEGGSMPAADRERALHALARLALDTAGHDDATATTGQDRARAHAPLPS